MKFPFIDILLKLFWFIVISKIIRFSRYRYYLLWNLAHYYIGIEIPFFYSIYSIFKFYLNTKNITIIIKWIKASVNAFAVLHWIASRFTKKDYKLLFPDKKQFFNHCLLLLTLEAGDLLARLKTISRYRKAHMSCHCCETFFKSSVKKHPFHYCS